MQWLIGIGSSIVALLVAGLIGWAGSDNGSVWQGWPIFLLCGVFAFAVQWVMFIHAWSKHTEHFFDLTGSLTYIVMVSAAVVLSGAWDTGSLLIAGLIVLWAVRLGSFLFKRVRKAGEDRRFRQMKHIFPQFFMTWTLQGTWVYITAAAALAAITGQGAVPLVWSFWLGAGLWVIGFSLEVMADTQKSAFKLENPDEFINTGLWAWSRHPNYFGEILLWVGIAVMAYPALAGWQLLTLISPLFVVFLLTLVSGVRMLEARSNKRWGNDPEYQAYKQATPVLIPRPPR